jgi:hypothetical protein
MGALSAILLNVRRSLSVNVDFRPRFLSAVDIFSRFVCADITLQTVALDTPNNVAVFVTDAPAKRTQTISLFQNRTSLPLTDSFTRTVTQHNH